MKIIKDYNLCMGLFLGINLQQPWINLIYLSFVLRKAIIVLDSSLYGFRNLHHLNAKIKLKTISVEFFKP